MKFIWDELKSINNMRKHGICFEIARQIFDDPLILTKVDCFKDGEERYQSIGMSKEGQLLVIHTTMENTNGEMTIRIISARHLTKSEVKENLDGSLQNPSQVLGHRNGENSRGWFGPNGLRKKKFIGNKRKDIKNY